MLYISYKLLRLIDLVSLREVLASDRQGLPVRTVKRLKQLTARDKGKKLLELEYAPDGNWYEPV